MTFSPFNRSSISRKIAVIVISSWLLIALVITSFFVGQEIYSFRTSKVADLNGLARVISVNCTAPLEFGDVETATEVLSSLSARPQIDQAAIYTVNAKLFAHYVTPTLDENGLNPPQEFPYNPKEQGDEAFFFKDRRLELYVPIQIDGKILGTLYLGEDLNDLSKKLTRTAYVVGGIMAASLFLAWLVFSMLQRYISRPILEMTEIMGCVSKDKTYSKRIENGFTDELGVLADGFNTMLDHIQQRDKQLLDAKTVAEDANRAKSKFLAQMSHEIRTPMNAIMGMTHLAIASNPGDKVKKFLETVKISADNLLGILNDILDFSKIEAGQLLMSQQPFLLKSVLESIISTMNMSAVEKGLKLHCAEKNTFPPAYIGDDLRLRQILFNLVGNAIKFTREGTVSIMVESVEDVREDDEDITLHFSIADSGIGIAKDKLEVIFNSFEQADSSYVRSYGGTGLGLAISRQLTQMMGGTMWVESEIGVGSIFHFTVRMQPCDEALIPDLTSMDTAAAPVTGLQVLIVDDNEVNRELAHMVLESDHHVTTAVDGLDALHALIAKPFDVVLMDVQMPVMDGLSATQIIRAVEEGREPPPGVPEDIVARLQERLFGKHLQIIAMTAHAMGRDHELCERAGMDNYLTKPFQPEQLSASLWKIGRDKGDTAVPVRADGLLPSTAAAKASIEQIVAYLQANMDLSSEQIEKVLAASRKSIQDNLAEMKHALAAEDLETLAVSAHTIKGTLLQSGLSDAAQKAQALYDKARSEMGYPHFARDIHILRKHLEPIWGPSQGADKHISETLANQ